MILCALDVVLFSFVCFFFFKQKTAYEMRISDWSSDVCSSDLAVARKRVNDLQQMIVVYVIGARNLTDRTETTIVERKVDQNPERIIGVAREPQPPLPRETSSNTGYLYNSDMLRGEFLSLQMTCPGD